MPGYSRQAVEAVAAVERRGRGRSLRMAARRLEAGVASLEWAVGCSQAKGEKIVHQNPTYASWAKVDTQDTVPPLGN